MLKQIFFQTNRENFYRKIKTEQCNSDLKQWCKAEAEFNLKKNSYGQTKESNVVRKE